MDTFSTNTTKHGEAKAVGRLGRAAAPLFALVTCRGRWACVGGKRYTCLGCLESLASHIFYAALKMCAAEDSERPTKGSVIILGLQTKKACETIDGPYFQLENIASKSMGHLFIPRALLYSFVLDMRPGRKPSKVSTNLKWCNLFLAVQPSLVRRRLP